MEGFETLSKNLLFCTPSYRTFAIVFTYRVSNIKLLSPTEKNCFISHMSNFKPVFCMAAVEELTHKCIKCS